MQHCLKLTRIFFVWDHLKSETYVFCICMKTHLSSDMSSQRITSGKATIYQLVHQIRLLAILVIIRREVTKYLCPPFVHADITNEQRKINIYGETEM